MSSGVISTSDLGSLSTRACFVESSAEISESSTFLRFEDVFEAGGMLALFFSKIFRVVVLCAYTHTRTHAHTRPHVRTATGQKKRPRRRALGQKKNGKNSVWAMPVCGELFSVVIFSLQLCTSSPRSTTRVRVLAPTLEAGARRARYKKISRLKNFLFKVRSWRSQLTEFAVSDMASGLCPVCGPFFPGSGTKFSEFRDRSGKRTDRGHRPLHPRSQ